MRILINTIKKVIKLLGIEVKRVKSEPIDIPKLSSDFGFTDIQELNSKALQIPGMISKHNGQALYTLSFMQDLQGDVLEIGSWQGRSTIYLAQAIKDCKNGKLYAVDHFKGNVGKQHLYKVGSSDLSDLKQNFINNMSNVKLSEYVELLDLPSEEAGHKLANKKFRFVFIDGDHSAYGVRTDLSWILPCCLPGAIIVFDDYSNTFPGLLSEISNLLTRYDKVKIFAIKNALILKLPIP